MNKKKIVNTLATFFKEEKISNELKDYIVYQEIDGSYQLFDQYAISKHKELYVLNKLKTYTEKTFISLRNAVTWSILDKSKNYLEANRVLELDLLLSGANENMKVHARLIKTAKDMDQALIYITKLDEDRIKKQLILYELNEYITKTTRWQRKKFEQKIAKSER
jgi:hypothetical protein